MNLRSAETLMGADELLVDSADGDFKLDHTWVVHW